MNILCPYSHLGCSFGEKCIKDSDQVLKCGYYSYFYFLDVEFPTGTLPIAINPQKPKINA